MGSTRSISFNKRDEADEIYTFPVKVKQPTFQIQNSVVMVDYQDDDEVLIIAGNLPGMTGYYKNYPDVIEGDSEKQKEHDLAQTLLEEAEAFLSEYEPRTSSSSSNQGNRSMNDIYVTVDEKNRDEVVMRMWKMLHHLRDRHIEFLRSKEEEEHHEYPQLEEEILEITMKSDIGDDSELSG